mmetsp:Transcript_22582/g.75881  ORF Transcript_22582/g.75881 Transcript_22582/m.75881 type:complete len:155 (-) Transcript_22582:318-782(-)
MARDSWMPILLAASLIVGVSDALTPTMASKGKLQWARRQGVRSTIMLSDSEEKPGFLGRLSQGLDDFIDDAIMRKLGNGASFYGKRKSNFYGKNDPMKKSDPRVADTKEDYRGNAGGSYFVWDKEWDMALTRKQARMKKQGRLQRPGAPVEEER